MLENAIITLNYSAASNETPFNFSAQFQFIDECTKERLIESYYDLDGLLCREIVGKKLSSRLRKDLDEICEKISTTDKSVVACGAGAVGLRLKSARRQFDNVKRVFKTIEEMGGDYVTNIKIQVISKRRANTSNDHCIIRITRQHALSITFCNFSSDYLRPWPKDMQPWSLHQVFVLKWRSAS